jgi:hypothetical protein
VGKIKDLFEAYDHNDLPAEGGYIISSFFAENSAYSRYEIISYSNVKDIYHAENGLTFQAQGTKVFILVEPKNYSQKHVEPAYRDDAHKIPYRFKELDTYTTRRDDKVFLGKEPVETYSSFTVVKGAGHDRSMIAYRDDDILDTVQSFFEDSLWKEAGVPKRDAAEVTKGIINQFKRIII